MGENITCDCMGLASVRTLICKADNAASYAAAASCTDVFDMDTYGQTGFADCTVCAMIRAIHDGRQQRLSHIYRWLDFVRLIGKNPGVDDLCTRTHKTE